MEEHDSAPVRSNADVSAWRRPWACNSRATRVLKAMSPTWSESFLPPSPSPTPRVTNEQARPTTLDLTSGRGTEVGLFAHQVDA
jgi:hypothetical protein